MEDKYKDLMEKLDRCKRTFTYLCKRFHRKNSALITYPSYLTGLVIIAFIILSVSKEKHLLSLDMNEIGDSLAGFAGVLAFLWIIVTVLMQNKDLKLQYAEIKDMREASESQARSLKSAEIFKALEYVELKLEQITPRIEECREIIDSELQQFIELYATGRIEGAYFDAEKDIPEMWGYFRKKDAENEIYYPLESVKEDFDYIAYLKLETVLRNMGYVIDALDHLVENADSDVRAHLLDKLRVYEQFMRVHWYREWVKHLSHVEMVVKQVIIKNEIGSDMARLGVEMSLRRDKEKGLI